MNRYRLLASRMLDGEIAYKARTSPGRSSKLPRSRSAMSGRSTADQKATAHAAVEVFGGPIVRVADRRLSLSPFQAYLVGLVFGQRDGWLSRAQVAELLWEEDGPDARHRLSQLLYSFTKKQALSTLFEADPETVGPGPAARDLDIERFQRAVGRGELQEAADLLDRGFLSDLPSVPTRAFQDWLDGRRATLRSTVRNPAATQWSHFSAEEAWSSAARAATVLLRLDPLDEGALRNVLWSRGMAGRVHEALAEYRSFRERLGAGDDDRGSEVHAETEEIVRRLESLEQVAPSPPEIPVRTPEPEPELCGRDEELATLSRAIASPSASALTTVVVSGEAGMGKTRLVEEAMRGARLRGFRVLRAGSSEFEGNIPLNPLLEALDDERTGGAMARLDDPWHSVLLSLMPQFHQGDGPLPEVPYVEPGSLPRRTYEALRRLVVSIVSDGPLLLFLDDFQWADDTSVAAVEFLRRRWSGGRIVLILAVRRHGILKKTRGEELAEELLAEGEALHIDLDELDEDASEALIDQVADRDLDSHVRREISALAGRNPFFAVELTHEYLRGHLEMGAKPGEYLPVPVSIRQLLEPRLEELSSSHRNALEVLAVYGHEVNLPDAGRLLDQSSLEACAEMLDHLQNLRLVRWVGTNVVVRHELIRHTVYGRLSGGSKALKHERVARWLEGRDGTSPGELALHFDRAGIRDDALRCSLDAAKLAEASGAVPEAVRFLTTARRNTDDPETAARIVGRLGHLHYLHRNFHEAAPLLDLAAERFRRQGHVSAALRAEVERLDALSRLELLPIEDFIQKSAEMKRELETAAEWETLAKLLDVEVHTLDRVGNIEGVRRVLGEAERIADKGSPEAQCTARATLAVNSFYGDPKRGLEFARSAVEIAKHNGLTNNILVAVNRLALTLMIQGIFEQCDGEALCEDVEQIAQRSGDLYQRFSLYGNRGLWYADCGDYEKARAFFAKAFEILRGTPAALAQTSLNINAGECELLAHQVDRAKIYFTEAEHSAAKTRVPDYSTLAITAGLGLCALFEGDLGEARQREASLSSPSSPWVHDPYLAVVFRARMLAAQKGPARGAKYVNEEAKTIKDRFVTCYIKLKLEEARLRSRSRGCTAQDAAEEGLRVCKEIGLKRRAREFEAFF